MNDGFGMIRTFVTNGCSQCAHIGGADFSALSPKPSASIDEQSVKPIQLYYE